MLLPRRSASLAIPEDRFATIRYSAAYTVKMILRFGCWTETRNAWVSAFVATSPPPDANNLSTPLLLMVSWDG